MARDTGEKENRQANEQYTAMQQDQLRRANAATDSFNSLLGKVQSGKPIAANPYKTSEYLRNQNLLTGAATSAQNAGAKELLNTDALRSGVNTASRRATIADLGRQRTPGSFLNILRIVKSESPHISETSFTL